MIVSSVNYKGGTGKSTIAQNLAVAFSLKGYKVCIVDADGTGATMDWSEDRHELGLEPVIMVSHLTNPASFTSQVKALYNDGGYDLLIIDCPPALSPVAVKAMSISDYLFIPINTTGGNDIKVTQKLLKEFQKIREIKEDNGGKVEAYLLANGYKRNVILHESVIKIMDQLCAYYKVKRFKTVVHNRVVYGEASMKGRGVVELDNKKATLEVGQLVKEILAMAGN
jgi:chromosome partitioning protein